jgi:hypothetical protein
MTLHMYRCRAYRRSFTNQTMHNSPIPIRTKPKTGLANLTLEIGLADVRNWFSQLSNVFLCFSYDFFFEFHL